MPGGAVPNCIEHQSRLVLLLVTRWETPGEHRCPEAARGVKVSWDMADDADSLFNFLAEDGCRNLALVLDDQMINGSGVAPNLSGILIGGAN
jgi:hypothetical protein